MFEIQTSRYYDEELSRILSKHRIKEVKKLDRIVGELCRGEVGSRYSNHPLKGNKAGWKELHISGNLLLEYKHDYSSNTLILNRLYDHKEQKQQHKESFDDLTQEEMVQMLKEYC